MTSWNQRVWTGIALLLLGTASEAAAQPSRLCTRKYQGTALPLLINGTHELHRSTYGNSLWDTAFWPTNAVNAYGRAWEGWWYMDTTNHPIFIGATTTGDTYTGWAGSAEVVHRYNAFTGSVATAVGYNIWPSNYIEHIDIRVSGPTNNVALPNPAIQTSAVFHSTSCVFAAGSSILSPPTESHVLAHEIGHAYGYDHFESWLATMNAFYTGSWNCELNTAPSATESMYVMPAALDHQCHDIVYGIYDAVDLGINPHYLISTPGAVAASTIDGGLTTFIPASNTSFNMGYTRYTTFSNRDTYTGFVNVRGYLSTDRVWSAGDAQIYSMLTNFGWAGGDTTTRSLNVTFNPQLAMPLVGVTYFLLLVVDPLNAIPESRESNNVTDMGRFYVRF